MRKLMANYDLKHLDPDHDYAYKACNELLQAFIDRQCRVRDIEKKNGQTEQSVYERKVNAEVISFIQWVRYHLWGNDDVTIANKTHITIWTFGYKNTIYGIIPRGTYCISNSPFACEILGFDPMTYKATSRFDPVIYKVTATEIVEAILNIIIPKREHSIFAINDQVTESITLKQELDRIKQKIYPNDPLR